MLYPSSIDHNFGGWLTNRKPIMPISNRYGGVLTFQIMV